MREMVAFGVVGSDVYTRFSIVCDGSDSGIECDSIGFAAENIFGHAICNFVRAAAAKIPTN